MLCANSSATAYEPQRCRAPIEEFGRYKVVSVQHQGADVALRVEPQSHGACADGAAGAVAKLTTLILQGFWYVVKPDLHMC